eukprot:SAG22_NODE_1164_length_5294_cov_3.888162_5_plen_238_part_01
MSDYVPAGGSNAMPGLARAVQLIREPPPASSAGPEPPEWARLRRQLKLLLESYAADPSAGTIAQIDALVLEHDAAARRRAASLGEKFGKMNDTTAALAGDADRAAAVAEAARQDRLDEATALEAELRQLIGLNEQELAFFAREFGGRDAETCALFGETETLKQVLAHVEAAATGPGPAGCPHRRATLLTAEVLANCTWETVDKLRRRAHEVQRLEARVAALEQEARAAGARAAAARAA